MSSQPTPPSKSSPSSDEPKVVSADGTPLPEPTFEERAQVFWIENKKTILLTCVLVLLVLLAKEFVLYYIDQRERAIAGEFSAAENNTDKLRAFTAAHADHQLAGLAWLALGDAAFKDGKFAEAETAYGKAVPLTTGSVFVGRARVGQAFSQSVGGDKAKAEASFKAIVADAGLPSATRSEARYHLAVLAIETGRFEDARKSLDEVEATDLSGAWQQRARSLRANLPPVPVVAGAESPAAAPAADASIKLSLPGSQ